MSTLDFLLAGLIVAPLFMGLWRGLLQPAATLAGLVLGGWLALRFAKPAAGALADWGEDQGWLELLCFGAILVGTALFASLAAHLLDRLLREGGLKWADRLLGAGAGGLVGLLVAAAVVVASAGLLPPESEAVERSTLAPMVMRATRWVSDWLPDDMKQRFQDRLRALAGELPEGSGPPRDLSEGPPPSQPPDPP